MTIKANAQRATIRLTTRNERIFSLLALELARIVAPNIVCHFENIVDPNLKRRRYRVRFYRGVSREQITQANEVVGKQLALEAA